MESGRWSGTNPNRWGRRSERDLNDVYTSFKYGPTSASILNVYYVVSTSMQLHVIEIVMLKECRGRGYFLQGEQQRERQSDTYTYRKTERDRGQAVNRESEFFAICLHWLAYKSSDKLWTVRECSVFKGWCSSYWTALKSLVCSHSADSLAAFKNIWGLQCFQPKGWQQTSDRF